MGRVIALLAVLSGGSACSLIESATSTIVVSGVVIASPEIRYAGLYDVDSEVLATAWVGERDSGTSSKEPTPLSGIAVTITFDDRVVALREDSGEPGVYLASSIEEPTLAYREGSSYVFDAAIGDLYGGEGEAPPRLQAGELRFTPALGTHATIPQLKTHQRNTALTLTWPQDAGRYAYVAVFRGDPARPDQPEPVFDTRPKTSQEILDFVVGEPPTSAEIPANVFARDGLYAAVLVAVNKGGPRSNTFFGSPYLVGSGAAELFAIGEIGP